MGWEIDPRGCFSKFGHPEPARGLTDRAARNHLADLCRTFEIDLAMRTECSVHTP
jgi:hypothetical protein